MTRAAHELLGETLVAAGHRCLEERSKVLGLPQNTALTILKANHKNSGQPATVITRMLAAPDVPDTVRVKIFGYIEETSAGLFGNDKARARKYCDRVGAGLTR